MSARVSLVILLLASVPPAANAGPVGGDSDIVVRADVDRMEIERILNADNLDTEFLGPREIADAIAAIPRGRAPEDFWLAYQKHVDAWLRLAELEENGSMGGYVATDNELAAADRAINWTFDEVERIAALYGARMPVPMADVRRTV